MEPLSESPGETAAGQTGDDHTIRNKRQKTDMTQIDLTAMKDGDITVRGSLNEASKFMRDTVQPDQKVMLRNHGCGFMLDFNVGAHISKCMMVWLYSRFIEDTLTIDLGSGEHLHITEHVVHVIYGFPKEKNGKVPSPSGERDTSAISWLKRHLNCGAKQHLVASDLYSHVSKGGMDDFTMKLIILVFFMKTTCATSNARIGREDGMVMNLDFKELKDMNLCGLVLNELKRALTKFCTKEGKKKIAEGPAALPLLYYLYTQAHGSADLTTRIPRVSQLDVSNMNKIIIDDWNDITNNFGKLTPPACDIDNSNTSEDDCTAQDRGPLIQSTVQPASHYDGTGRAHEANDCEMVCEMQAPELCHTVDTIQPTSHEMMVCDGTTRPDAKISGEFNATGTCQEHAFVHDNMPDAETSLPCEEQTYTVEVHKDTEPYVTEQNNTSTDQATTTKIDSDTSCQYADLHGSSRTNDPCTTYHPEDTVVSVAGSADSAAVNNVRQDDAGAFDITQEVVFSNDNHFVSGTGYNTSVCEGALESSACLRHKGSEWANEALCGTNSIKQVCIGNGESNREGNSAMTAYIDEINEWSKPLIRGAHGLSVSFAGDVADSSHAGGFMRRSVLQFALDYIRVYKANMTTKILGPEVGEALVSKVELMPENARRLFTPESKDVLDNYSFIGRCVPNAPDD
ncbi:hypothetical protein ACQ4PT_069163 [Festuca glaucescens]